ncbi:alkene reductase [Hydrogenovibrio halophilus]|uniref:alkene reductase n=1 Tax=Hydrogenovibrio halophilus TaxID=373391 RepID=UPI0003A40FFA|nr:alkene reductase [Hydrogenovibrio halophilus]
MKQLLSPIQIGRTDLSNRIFMAPLTRSRAQPQGNVPGDLNVTYYTQRASAGLIVTEATPVSQQGQGYAYTPGMYTDAQEAGWKKVVDSVHAKGGHLSLQLWHVGRISNTEVQANGAAPVAPSAIQAENSQCSAPVEGGSLKMVPCAMPRALKIDEMPGIVAQYRQAAIRGLNAGFDFFEVHSANGYLLHQFLATHTNQRTDDYGGSLPNRARLVLEVLDAVIEAVGKDKVGVRLSPNFVAHDMSDDESEEMTLYLARAFSERGIAYLHIAEPDWAGGDPLTDAFRSALRDQFAGALIFCGNYDADKAEKTLSSGVADAIAFGRAFIANPDLVERIREDAELNPPNPDTFYGGGAEGYTDYPFLETSSEK